MGIKDWPEGERPRERLLSQGAQALSDAELLAIFLRTGVRGRSALDLARDLLAHFGGLRGLLGPAKFAQLHATVEMARRFLAERMTDREPLKSPGEARDYLNARLRDLPHESFCALFLDNQHRVLACEELAKGTIDGASVYPREVVKAALKRNAAAVIFAHNHPSGVAEPSAADRALTERLKTALGTVDIRVLDHIVIGEVAVSFAERGWI
jgi:DNA repair protein RadC